MTADLDEVQTDSSPPRREPLPDCQPKPVEDDPQAPERLRRIMESPAYVRADNDPMFLHRDDMRHARLELEYLKPELSLQAHGVRSTIVLFGGTRIAEPAAAERRLDALRAALEASPGDPELKRSVEVAERIVAKSRYYDVAREFARRVSEYSRERGLVGEYVVATGGGPGIMEAGNRGAFDVDSPSIGMNITLPMEQFPNPYITPELCFQFRYFALRKLHFLKRAKALVAFPGGYGTLDELFDALCLVQTRKIEPMPIVLVGTEFWRNAFNAQYLADEGVIATEDLALFSYAETAQEIVDAIVGWTKP